MRHRPVARRLVLPALIVFAGMFACTGNDMPTEPSGANGSGSGGSGSLTIKVTDSPFSDARAVLVTFSEVTIHSSESSWETLPFAGGAARRTCDLKKLVGATDVLGVAPLKAGHYQQIRLNVESAAIYFDSPSIGPACAPAIAPPAGTFAPVEVSSGNLKLNRQFTLASGGATTITLDFDGDKSIKQVGGGNGNGNGNGKGGNSNQTGRYMMTPVIGIVSVQ
jgi:Domain of unknown function (DUF4382)